MFFFNKNFYFTFSVKCYCCGTVAALSSDDNLKTVAALMLTSLKKNFSAAEMVLMRVLWVFGFIGRNRFPFCVYLHKILVQHLPQRRTASEFLVCVEISVQESVTVCLLGWSVNYFWNSMLICWMQWLECRISSLQDYTTPFRLSMKGLHLAMDLVFCSVLYLYLRADNFIWQILIILFDDIFCSVN